MNTAYLISALIMFSILMVRWSNRGWSNMTFKLLLFVMAGWSSFFLLQQLGYIVKIG